MINYPGDYAWPECLDMLAASGIVLVAVDDVPQFDVDAANAVVAGYTLDQAKAWRCAQVRTLAADLRAKVVDGYSPAEMSSWPIKRAEVQAYRDGAPCPTLTAEATARGIPLADVVKRVNENSALFLDMEARISGVSGKHRDAIQQLGTFAAVAAYDHTTGWPSP